MPHASTSSSALRSETSPISASAGADFAYSDQCRELATTTSTCVTEREADRLVKRCQHLHEVFRVCGTRQHKVREERSETCHDISDPETPSSSLEWLADGASVNRSGPPGASPGPAAGHGYAGVEPLPQHVGQALEEFLAFASEVENDLVARGVLLMDGPPPPKPGLLSRLFGSRASGSMGSGCSGGGSSSEWDARRRQQQEALEKMLYPVQDI